MRILGVSAGNGVNLFPFKEHVIGNIEMRADYTIKGQPDQFLLNFPQASFSKELTTEYLSVEVIIGNPKCGSSSMLALSRAKKFKSHKDEPSLDLFFDSIKMYQPKVFMMENLPKLLETYSILDLDSIFPNYHLETWEGTMDMLGNSQKNRRRLILTGVKKTRSRRGDAIRKALMLKFKVGIPKKTGELLLDLPINGSFRPPLDEQIAIYGGRQMTYQEIHEMWREIHPDTRIKTPKEKFNTAPGVYKDLADKPPSTIRKSNRCFNPAGLSYSPRERARIQGIPDDFKILDIGYPLKTLFNKGCITTGSTPSYEVGVWFYEALKTVFHDL